jgi:hypothetical protein
MAYGNLKADNLIYDDNGTDTVVPLAHVAGKATLASPAFTGTPTAPTAAAGTHTTQLATTAYVQTEFAPLASPVFTGSPTVPGYMPFGGGTFTGDLQIDNAKKFILSETDANGTHYLSFKAPDSVTATVDFTLPDGAGSNGQLLQTNGSGVLSWSTTDLSAYAPLAGPALTGNATAVNLTLSGDLTVNGTTTTIDTTNLVVEDPLISLSRNNSGGDSLDIGFYGLYVAGGLAAYTGLFRDANDSGKWKLFELNQAEPTTTVDDSGTGYAAATLVVGTLEDSKGDVRTIPLRAVTSAAATLALTDAGKVVSTDTIGWTVPALSWTAGDTVTLLNNSAGGLVITCSAVTTYLTSDGSTVTGPTLGARGMATLYFTASNTCYISGAGLS